MVSEPCNYHNRALHVIVTITIWQKWDPPDQTAGITQLTYHYVRVSNDPTANPHFPSPSSLPSPSPPFPFLLLIPPPQKNTHTHTHTVFMMQDCSMGVNQDCIAGYTSKGETWRCFFAQVHIYKGKNSKRLLTCYFCSSSPPPQHTHPPTVYLPLHQEPHICPQLSV